MSLCPFIRSKIQHVPTKVLTPILLMSASMRLMTMSLSTTVCCTIAHLVFYSLTHTLLMIIWNSSFCLEGIFFPADSYSSNWKKKTKNNPGPCIGQTSCLTVHQEALLNFIFITRNHKTIFCCCITPCYNPAR